MYLIGLTGGIASGKSVVARRMAEQGAVHIDADQLAREAVEPGTAALEEIRESFGPEVIAADGSLDRAALGTIVFADRDRLDLLNRITHPAVRKLSAKRVAAAEASDSRAVVVYDVPLLVEAKTDRDRPFDLVVVVHADAQTRRKRLTSLRGMSREDAQRRIDSQASDEERLAVADVVIDSGGTVEHTLTQADALYRRAAASAAESVLR